MSNWRNLLLAAIIIITLVAMLPSCRGKPEPTPELQPSPAPLPAPSPTPQPTPKPSPMPAPAPVPPPQPSPAYQSISGRIAEINPAEHVALASLLTVSQELNAAQAEGAISGKEGEKLGGALGDKFSDFVKNQVDAIDPTDLGALNDFFMLQRVQGLDEYDEHCTPQTKQYKEDQMEEKFNDYIRNWVDHIDPSEPSGLNDIFFLQKIQNCGKYQLASVETDQYKHEQMGNKFNEWVRNALDNLDPSNPDDLQEIVFLQKLQSTEKWEEYATPETEEYKHEQLEEKFNQWVRERVDELDPDDPNFQEELEKLRVLQRIEKYKELVTPETHAYKEEQLSVKLGEYVTNAVDNMTPGLVEGLDELVALQRTSIYQDFCPEKVKEYKEEQLRAKFNTEPGVPPKVVGLLPENGEVEVGLNQPILLVFDQPMEPASVANVLEIVPAINAELTWLDGNFIFLLHPTEALDFNTTYTVYLGSGAQSEAGLLLEESYNFSFTTEHPDGAPRVIETLPSDGQLDASVGQAIEITFDQPMDPTSVETAITVSPAIDHLIYWRQNDTVAVIMPLRSMEFNTSYSVEIGAEATSADGLALASGLSFQFLTGIVPAPRVMGTLPYDGQQDIPSNHPIIVIFDWPMDPTSVESALTVSPELDYEIEWLEANFVMKFKPLTKLADNTRYTLEIAEGAKTNDGLLLSEGLVLTFTTAQP